MMGLLTNIRDGKYDEHLDRILQVVIERRKELASDRYFELQIGDRVKFVRTIRPTYLAGAHATVVGKKVKKVLVRLDSPVGRFGMGDIRCSPGQIEKLQEGGQ